MTDEQLLRLAQKGDESAEEELLEKYKPLVRARARELFLAGGEQEDLLQEGMLGLFRAIRHYDAEKEASFATYARLLVTRQMYHAIEAAQREKHKVLNQSISIQEIEENQESGFLGTSESPEMILLDLENERELRDTIDRLLSPLEREVLEAYLQGADYLQIAEEMGRSAKSVDNALQRIRSKVRKYVLGKERAKDGSDQIKGDT